MQTNKYSNEERRRQFVESLCNLEIPGSLTLSPNDGGRRLLYATALTWDQSRGKEGILVASIWLADTGVRHSARRLTNGDFKEYSPAWTPDGQSVAFISDRAGAARKWAIYVFDPKENDTAKAYPVTPVENEKQIEAFKISPDGKYIAYLSSDEKTAKQRHREEPGQDMHVYGEDISYARLRIVHLATGKVRSLETLDAHVFDLAWSPDSNRVAIFSSTKPEFEDRFVTGSTMSVVHKTTMTVRQVCHFPREANELIWPEAGRLYFCAPVPEHRVSAGYGLYVTEPESKSLGYHKLAFGVDEDVTNVRELAGEVIVRTERGLECRICRPDGTSLYAAKEELESFDVVLTDDGRQKVIAVATSNINKPVEVYTISSEHQEPVQLSDHGSIFEAQQFGTCDFLSYQTADGKEDVDAMYLTPSSEADLRKPQPTVVLIHGGPATRLTNAFNTYYFMWAPYLLSLGYGVLIPNYRGSSGRGERFASYAYEGTGVIDYADVISATQYAIEQGYAAKDRVIVGGWSHGGFLTNVCSVRNGLHGHGWKFKAAISGASICESDAMALSSELCYVYQPELNNGRIIWNMDVDDTRNRRASPLWEFRNAMQHSKQMATMVIPPMLILHPQEDTRCPLAQAWGLRRALESYNLPFECVTYPRSGHFQVEQKFWIDMALRIGRLCDKYIGEKSEAIS